MGKPMKHLILFAGIVTSGLANAAQHNHLLCQEQTGRVFGNCYVESGAVKFEGGEDNPTYNYEMSYTIQTDFACPGNFQSAIQLSAGAHNPGAPIRFGTQTDVLIGQGPVVLNDLNSAMTLALKTSGNCTLSFHLKGVEPSQGQVASWTAKAEAYAGELNELSAVYQSQTTIMFWDKKVKSGDQKVLDLVVKLRDDTQAQISANSENFILQFRLDKLNEIISKVPTADIKDSYKNILEDIKDTLILAKDVRALMTSYNKVVPEGLVKSIDTAEALVIRNTSN